MRTLPTLTRLVLVVHGKDYEFRRNLFTTSEILITRDTISINSQPEVLVVSTAYTVYVGTLDYQLIKLLQSCFINVKNIHCRLYPDPALMIVLDVSPSSQTLTGYLLLHSG